MVAVRMPGWGVLAIALATATWGCEGSGAGTTGVAGTAQLSILVTDAPGGEFASAEITVGGVHLIDTAGQAVPVTEAGGTFDLLDLQDGVTAVLATASVPAGRYVQMRMVIEAARVTLADGHRFTDGAATRDLFVPGGARSGLKINLFGTDWTMGMPDSGRSGRDPDVVGQGRARAGRQGAGSDSLVRSNGVAMVPGETIIVLDFDVTRNFVLQGPPGAPHGALFTPMIRAVVRDIAGSISGQVVAGDGAPVDGATIRAVLVESPALEALQTTEAMAVSDANGGFTLWYLCPGTYTVSVEGSTSDPLTVVVGDREAVTGVTLPAS